MADKRRSTRRTSAARGRRKKGGTSFFSKLRRFPLWGYVLVALSVVALYCFILFHYFVDPYSFQWKAIYGETTYPDGYDVRGIDISHYQQEIDWERLRNANMGSDPVSFVIVKATEGVSIIDEYFNDNFYKARKNDFVRGAYHFMTPDVPAGKQARFYIHQVHLEEGDLPPILDIEDERKWLSSGLDHRQIQNMALEWLQVVEKHYGIIPIIYCGYKFRKDILVDKSFDRYPLWVAHYYVDKPRTDISWTFWQHTDCGKVKGVRGSVDCNLFNGSRARLDSLLISEVP